MLQYSSDACDEEHSVAASKNTCRHLTAFVSDMFSLQHSILSKRNPHKLRETLEWIRSHFGLDIVRSCSTLWQRSVQLKLEPTLQGLLASGISMDYIKAQPWLLTQNPGDEVDPARAMNMQTTFD